MNILRDPVVLLLASFLLGWAVYSGTEPPPERPASAPDTRFSSSKAKVWLDELYAENQPHVSGSPQNIVVRDRVVSILSRFSYTPEIQSLFHCKPEFGSCSPVENIIAIKRGTAGGSAILLTVHYDSAWAGPGVADDGAGVAATLEIARMVSVHPEFTHDLIFLFTDAEEQGLIGADAFAKLHPLFARVQAVINLEARGLSGASTMFETGLGNRRTIRLLANHVEHPAANSVAYEVYKRMPNDTDFSVYRERGLPGVNFAFTGGAAGYHSRIDDLEHLDLRSLQHHGENAWSMLQALDEYNLDRLVSSEDAVYIDLFGQKLLHYPISSAAGLALVLSVLVIIAIRRSFRRLVVFRQVIWTTLAVLFMAAALPASGWLLSWPLGHWVDTHTLEHPYPWLGRSALIIAAVWIVQYVLKLLASRVYLGSVMSACWTLYVVLALVLAYWLPIVGFIAVLPLVAFTLGLSLDAFRWKKPPRLLFANLCGFFAAAYLGLYFFFQLDVVLNFEQSWLKILPLLLPAIAIMPLLLWYFEHREQKNGFSNTLLVLLVAVCAAQQFIPGYTLDLPRDMSLMYRHYAGQAQGLLVLESVTGRPDPKYARTHGFVPVKLPVFDEIEHEVLALDMETLELPDIPVKAHNVPVEGGADGIQRTMIELRIPTGVRLLAFDFPKDAGLQLGRFKGQLAFGPSPVTGESPESSNLVVNHPPPGTVQLELDFAAGFTGELQMTARFDLPEEVLKAYMDDWPKHSQPAFLGPRALQISRIKIGAEEVSQ